MLGTVITGVLAPWISQITFGNDQYTYSFVFLSVTLPIKYWATCGDSGNEANKTFSKS